MKYEHKRIIETLIAGTGIVQALHLGPDMYQYGDMPLALVLCKLTQHASLTNYQAWYAFHYHMADNTILTPMAVRWTCRTTIKWERLWEPAILLFGKEDKRRVVWFEGNPNLTAGTLYTKYENRPQIK